MIYREFLRKINLNVLANELVPNVHKSSGLQLTSCSERELTSRACEMV